MVLQPSARLLFRGRQALGMTQGQLAEKVGWSKRTLGRSEGGESTFSSADAATLAAHVHPVDRELAAELLALGGHTLVSAGLLGRDGLGVEAAVSPAEATGA